MNKDTKKDFPHSLGGQGKTHNFCILILSQTEWREQVMNDIDTLVVDAGHLSSAISALMKMSYEKIQLNSLKIEDINEMNAVIASVQCLAEKHAKDIEEFDRTA